MNIKEKYQICIYSWSMIRWCLKYIFIIISLCVAYFSPWRCGCTYCTSVHIRVCVCLFWLCNIAVVLCKVNIKGIIQERLPLKPPASSHRKQVYSLWVQREEKLPFLILCSICLPISQQTPPNQKRKEKKSVKTSKWWANDVMML